MHTKPPPAFSHERDGAALENLSDAIDTVNVLRGELQPNLMATCHAKATQNDAVQNGVTKNEKDEVPWNFVHDKAPEEFRKYENACDKVKDFYVEQHTKQTVVFNLEAREKFLKETRAEMGIWEAMEKYILFLLLYLLCLHFSSASALCYLFPDSSKVDTYWTNTNRLNTLIDESDPDTSLSQIEHLLQSAEAIRRDGKPRWMQLTGLIHDLGKLLFFFGSQGQWDVVGDTFPVGCAFSRSIILPGTFAGNPDIAHPVYSTKFGIYKPNCGMDNLMLSWGHDEYLYHVVKDQSTLPEEALAMIRYHSFYSWHKEGAYREFMSLDGKDERLLEAVKEFNPYDLYSKGDDVPNAEALKVCWLGFDLDG
jgi:inositol oxygenase